MSEETKKCPYCGEEILAVASKCKHCRSDLKKEIARSGETLGHLMLIVPFLAIMLIWFWIGNMNLLQSPGSKLNLISVGTIILTSLLAYLEASQLGFGKEKKETKPIVYFFGMVLVWIVVYPIYLYQRSKKGKKNLVVGGIVVALIFAGSYLLMNNAISEKVNEIQNILK